MQLRVKHKYGLQLAFTETGSRLGPLALLCENWDPGIGIEKYCRRFWLWPRRVSTKPTLRRNVAKRWLLELYIAMWREIRHTAQLSFNLAYLGTLIRGFSYGSKQRDDVAQFSTVLLPLGRLLFCTSDIPCILRVFAKICRDPYSVITWLRLQTKSILRKIELTCITQARIPYFHSWKWSSLSNSLY